MCTRKGKKQTKQRKNNFEDNTPNQIAVFPSLPETNEIMKLVKLELITYDFSIGGLLLGTLEASLVFSLGNFSHYD